ncbi:MAG TPA: hypothetical protein VJB14_01945, partial [Planctomycetota bacterium]|nr:hypothetical protein [Planctomycetota bacterium]
MNPREEHEEQRVDRRLKAVDREIQRLTDAYQAEVIELEELESRRKQAEEHRRMLEQRRRDIQRKHADRDRELRLLEGLDASCESVRGSLQDPPFEVKQSVLRLVVERVLVEDSRVVIHHVVPTEKFRLIPEWWALAPSGGFLLDGAESVETGQEVRRSADSLTTHFRTQIFASSPGRVHLDLVQAAADRPVIEDVDPHGAHASHRLEGDRKPAVAERHLHAPFQHPLEGGRIPAEPVRSAECLIERAIKDAAELGVAAG